jgi:hypothetical protein
VPVLIAEQFGSVARATIYLRDRIRILRQRASIWIRQIEPFRISKQILPNLSCESGQHTTSDMKGGETNTDIRMVDLC